MTLLDVRDLRVELGRRSPVVPVDGVSFTVDEDEVLGIVGESGCGKTMTALALLRLTPEPSRLSGQVLLDDSDVLALRPRELRQLRGTRVAMVFQEPMTSLDPVFTVGRQLVETLTAHRSIRRGAARVRARELLDRVGISEAERRLGQYPHELSGGMRQRVMIAIALANDPRLLVADEPTTALDVTVQAQVLELLEELRRASHMGVILITHDLAVVGDHATRVAVMYAGQIVESATTDAALRRASASLHPGPAAQPAGRTARSAAARHPGPRAGAGRHAARVPLRRPLPARARTLPRRGSGARRRRPPRAPAPLLQPTAACLRRPSSSSSA